MEVVKDLELVRMEEVKILNNVRLVHQQRPFQLSSQDNLQVVFELSGEVLGAITCFLKLDGVELTDSERNYLYPLFVESMNILIGGQLSRDPEFETLRIKLSPPKLIKLAAPIKASKKRFQGYSLELDSMSLDVLIEYQLQMVS
jgi:hypothetical protein